MPGYRIPGTRIEEVTQPSSVNITSSQRVPCFIGIASSYVAVAFDEITRSSTGLSDELTWTSNGIYQVTAVGSQRGLNDYIEGTHFEVTDNQIAWTSSGTVTIGATYFVSYQYNRPYDSDNSTDTDLHDYRYKEFTNFESVVADLGADIPNNPLVMICKIALQYFNVPKVATVQVLTGSTSDYASALTAIKYRDVQTVVPLTTSSAVRALVKTHVVERSLPDNARYRMAWFGAAAATAVGDENDATSIRGIAATLDSELCVVVNATRAIYYYNHPTTNVETTTVVGGEFIAAVLAAYRDSFVSPSATLLNRTVAGIELYDDDYDDYYSEYQLTLCGGSSVFIVESAGGTIKVIDDLTTDNSTVERNNINIITAKHYIAKDVAAQMDGTFRGRLILDSASYTNTIVAYLTALFTAYKRAGIVDRLGTITAEINATNRDTVDVFYSYYAVYTHKYTEGTYVLAV